MAAKLITFRVRACTEKELRSCRRSSNSTQKDFWSRIGVSQVHGSKLENKKEGDLPKTIRILLNLVHLLPEDDAIEYLKSLRDPTVDMDFLIKSRCLD